MRSVGFVYDVLGMRVYGAMRVDPTPLTRMYVATRVDSAQLTLTQLDRNRRQFFSDFNVVCTAQRLIKVLHMRRRRGVGPVRLEHARCHFAKHGGWDERRSDQLDLPLRDVLRRRAAVPIAVDRLHQERLSSALALPHARFKHPQQHDERVAAGLIPQVPQQPPRRVVACLAVEQSRETLVVRHDGQRLKRSPSLWAERERIDCQRCGGLRRGRRLRG
mmetsp:Transcript_41226/g.96313  ORF Transcript_41226/g.96313 Transcript_41226/m.96313 type:complete len:218 (-) Transcript_41226:921-1574(-)